MIFGVRGSIASQLMRSVFGVYLIVALVVTAVQLVSEYNHVKDTISQDLEKLKTTFGPSISNSVWSFDREGLKSILTGMNENADIVGVKVVTNESDFSQSVGVTDGSSKKGGELFSYSFPAVYTDPQNRHHDMGEVTVYSSTDIVFDRVEYGFVLILVNALIKSAALWLIALYFIRKILGRPLESLASEISTIQPDNLRTIDREGAQKNEFYFLVEAFNRMVLNLKDMNARFSDQNRKQQAELERRVEERTLELKLSEQKFRDYAEASADRFWEVNAQFEIIYASPVTETLRIPNSEFMGKLFWDFYSDRLDLLEVEELKDIMENHEAFRDLKMFSSLDSTPVCVSVSGKPIFSEIGEFLGYRGSTSDVSAEIAAKQRAEAAEKQFIQAMEKLEIGYCLWNADDFFLSCI